MTSHNRLTEVYQSAKEFPFDDKSKFVFFSDCHRGDNSWKDNFARNDQLFFYALNYYYKKGFTYIEIGDGDELWENKRFAKIKDEHSHIFWIMRKLYETNRFHLIFGEHNMIWKDQKNVKKYLDQYYDEGSGIFKPLFKDIEVHEGLILRHKDTDKKIFIVHGHQVDLLNDRFWRIGRFVTRDITRFLPFFGYWKYLQLFDIGIEDIKKAWKITSMKRIKVNSKIIEWVKENNQMTICGHTHKVVFPNRGMPPYFNSGSCIFIRCITGIEIQNGEITLIKWWIIPNEEGTLHIRRDVLAGPEKLQSFLK